MRQGGGSGGTLRWVPDPSGRAQVRLSGLPHPDPTRLLVFVGAQRETPLLGTTQHVGTDLLFTPRFPLLPSTTYTAVYESLSAAYQLPPRPATPPTRVVQVYPTAERLPLNLLKFYIHFSAPMRRGDSYRFVRLLDATNAPVELPFLELAEELWNPEQTRLTLLFDPGRIKRGVKPLEDIGGALEVGKRFTLEVFGTWPDAQDRPLVAPFRKVFTVTPAERAPLRPSRWRVTPPRAHTREPLTVVFERPVDHALAQRLLTVEKAQGAITLDQAERRWRFTPTAPWQKRRHLLRVSPLLEDVAGNNIGKTFDVDLAQNPAPFRPEPLRIPFTPH